MCSFNLHESLSLAETEVKTALVNLSDKKSVEIYTIVSISLLKKKPSYLRNLSSNTRNSGEPHRKGLS